MSDEDSCFAPDLQHPHNLRMYGKEELSDMTLVCGDQTWKLHKVIVFPLSGVLRAMLENKSWNESRDATVTINSDLFDAGTVSQMIQYIYKASYTVTELEDVVAVTADRQTSLLVHDLLPHFKVYAIADYYGMKDLMAYAEYRVQMVRTGRVYDPAFITIIKSLASLAPGSSELHEFVMEYAVRHSRKLLRNEEYIRERKTDERVQEFHDSLCLKLADKLSTYKEWTLRCEHDTPVRSIATPSEPPIGEISLPVSHHSSSQHSTSQFSPVIGTFAHGIDW